MGKSYLYIPKRYILTALAHFGFFVVYALRVNLSVALVGMVNSTYSHVAPSDDPECHTGNHTKNTDNVGVVGVKGGEFNWNQNQQGLILSSFFYGYLLTQLPGGWCARRFGGKWVFGIGVLCTSVLTLVTPIAARAGFFWLIVVRVLEGIGEGVTFPAMHSMIGQWSPSEELSRMFVFSYAGMYTGTIVALPVSGILADSSFLGGWPSLFYIFGISGFIWFALWVIFISNTPDVHPTISHEEKRLIMKDRKNVVTNPQLAPVPWIKIFKSVPVWACVCAYFCSTWVWYMVLTGLPSYFKQVLDFDLKENGFLSALPFMISFCTSLGAGIMADVLRRKYLSTTKTRKLMSFLGFYPASIFLVLASYTGCDQIALSVTYMTLATAMLCVNNGGYTVNIIDISPNFSGVIMGIANFMGTVAGCITPSVTGYFTNGHPNRTQYRKVFAIAASICAVGGTIFIIFASGKQQPWNDTEVFGDSKRVNRAEHDEEEPLLHPSVHVEKSSYSE